MFLPHANLNIRCRHHGPQKSFTYIIGPQKSSMLLSMVEPIPLCRPNVNNGRTAVAVLLQLHAPLAVVRVRHYSFSTRHTPLLPHVAVAVTDSGQRAWSHHRVAGDAAAVVCRADPADGDACELRAPHKVGLVPRD